MIVLGIDPGTAAVAVWAAAVSSVGVDPSTLPVWTANEPESPAN